MTIHIVLLLGQIIPPLLLPNPSHERVREFVYLCQRMASAYLRVKVRSGRLDPNTFGISLDDLALDCVAELFERSSDGRFTELTNYYGPLQIPSSSHADWLGATRRLVFSKVNEGLFRLYKENDRSLSNTIRNLKNSLRFSRTLFPVVKNNETWIQLAEQEPSTESAPLLPSELIEAQMLSESGHRRSLRGLLDIFAAILREQDGYQKQYPLVGLALIVRSVNVRTSAVPEEANEEDMPFTCDEVKRFVASSLRRTKDTLHPSYVEKGKLDQRTFDLYFECVSDILNAEYVSDDGIDLTYYETLRKRIAKLSESQYRKQHRVYLEYLAKLTRRNFLNLMRRELNP